METITTTGTVTGLWVNPLPGAGNVGMGTTCPSSVTTPSTPNSKFTIEIINIEYLKSRLTYDGILIRIAFGNKRESTKILSTSTNDLVWQQKFEL